MRITARFGVASCLRNIQRLLRYDIVCGEYTKSCYCVLLRNDSSVRRLMSACLSSESFVILRLMRLPLMELRSTPPPDPASRLPPLLPLPLPLLLLPPPEEPPLRDLDRRRDRDDDLCFLLFLLRFRFILEWRRRWRVPLPREPALLPSLDEL